MSENIERVRQYARRLFSEQRERLPIAPHLYFPQFADPKDNAEDAKAMEMGIDLLSKCHEIHVLGDRITAGMKAEINFAVEFGIPISHINWPEMEHSRNAGGRGL